MAAPPARARADYDFLIKLLLIGDSGMYFPLFIVLFSFCFFFSFLRNKRSLIYVDRISQSVNYDDACRRKYMCI